MPPTPLVPPTAPQPENVQLTTTTAPVLYKPPPKPLPPLPPFPLVMPLMRICIATVAPVAADDDVVGEGAVGQRPNALDVDPAAETAGPARSIHPVARGRVRAAGGAAAALRGIGGESAVDGGQALRAVNGRAGTGSAGAATARVSSKGPGAIGATTAAGAAAHRVAAKRAIRQPERPQVIDGSAVTEGPGSAVPAIAALEGSVAAVAAAAAVAACRTCW